MVLGPTNERARDSRLLRRQTCAALERLLPAMLPRIDLPRALLRGRYMKAAAAMEHNGTPIDTDDAGTAARTLDRYPRRADSPKSMPTMACSTGRTFKAKSRQSDARGDANCLG